MGKEWTDEEVSKEIADAVAIVREDRFEAFVRGIQKPSADNQNGGTDQSGNSGNGGGNDNPPPKKGRSLWWGETE
jgi:hypothetical protein